MRTASVWQLYKGKVYSQIGWSVQFTSWSSLPVLRSDQVVRKPTQRVSGWPLWGCTRRTRTVCVSLASKPTEKDSLTGKDLSRGKEGESVVDEHRQMCLHQLAKRHPSSIRKNRWRMVHYVSYHFLCNQVVINRERVVSTKGATTQLANHIVVKGRWINHR